MRLYLFLSGSRVYRLHHLLLRYLYFAGPALSDGLLVFQSAHACPFPGSMLRLVLHTPLPRTSCEFRVQQRIQGCLSRAWVSGLP